MVISFLSKTTRGERGNPSLFYLNWGLLTSSIIIMPTFLSCLVVLIKKPWSFN